MSKIRCNKKASKEPNILPGSGSVEHTHQCQINKMALLIPELKTTATAIQRSNYKTTDTAIQ